jgi:hypothetical protein
MRSRRRPKQTVQPARRVRISEANVSQKPVDVRVCQCLWRGCEKRRKRARGGVGAGIDAVELVDLVLDPGVEGNVDCERDERDEGGEEGEGRSDELEGQVRAERGEERKEGNASGCFTSA